MVVNLMMQKIMSQKKEERLIRLRKLKRKKTTSVKYFDKAQEKAIVDYINETDPVKKNRIYSLYIYYPFVEIVNNIVNTYKIGFLSNLEEKKLDCVRDMTDKIHMFKPEYNFKAFSYFSVIAKNWWLHELKKEQKETQNRFNIDTVSSLNEDGDTEKLEAMLEGMKSPEEIYEEQEEWQFFLGDKLDNWNDFIKKNTYLHTVFVGICVFLSSHEQFAISGYNRKALVDFVSDYTGLKKSQVINSLYRLRRNFRLFEETVELDNVEY